MRREPDAERFETLYTRLFCRNGLRAGQGTHSRRNRTAVRRRAFKQGERNRETHVVFGLSLAILGCGIVSGGPKKAPASKPGPRLELSPAPVAPANAPPGTAHANPLNVYGAQYPRIEADNRVTFHFKGPNAQKVQVGLVIPGQSSLSPIPVDMVKGDDGVWTYTSAPQSPWLSQLLDVRRWRSRARSRHEWIYRL